MPTTPAHPKPPAKPKPPAPASQGKLGRAADSVKKAVRGAVGEPTAEQNTRVSFLLKASATVAAIFTALGIQGGVVGNMARNFEMATALAFGLAVFAVIVGVIAPAIKNVRWQSRLLWFGMALFAASAVFAIIAAVGIWGERTAPRVSASVEPSPDGDVIKLQVKSDGLESEQRVRLAIWPVLEERGPGVSAHPVDEQGEPEGAYSYFTGGIPIYQSFTGPDGDGKVDTSPTVILPPDHPPRVVVQATVGDASPQECLEDKDDSGCVVLDVGSPGRPRISASIDDSTLNVTVSAADVAGRSVHVRAFAERGSRGIRLIAGELAADPAGTLDQTLSVRVPADVEKVCVVASLLERQACPPLQLPQDAALETCVGAAPPEVIRGGQEDPGLEAARKRCLSNYVAQLRRTTTWLRIVAS